MRDECAQPSEIKQSTQSPAMLSPDTRQSDHARPPHNLPAQLTTIVGRAGELQQVGEQLRNSSCRLLTLTGPGGVGKTRLALEAAQQLLNDPLGCKEFADGVFWVQLEPVESASRLPAVLAETLDYAFEGAVDPQIQLLHYLRNKSLLLVMDNFDRLVNHAGIVLAILQSAPQVKILVTSRERLHFDGEWLLEIGGLGYPQRGEDADLDRHPALQLFIRSAQAVHAAIPWQAELPAIVQICRRLDGLPLGIQLAATLVRAFTCQQIADELARNLDFLATSMRNVPPRHRTVRAVFEQSWALLTALEQEAFCHLAVFTGSFTASAAQEIAGVDLALLAALVDHSLLQAVAADGETTSAENLRRYYLHPALSPYVSEKLSADLAKLDDLRARHCAYFSRLAQDQSQLLKGSQVLQGLRTVTAELDNVRAAWRYAAATVKPVWLAMAAPGLVQYYLLRGPLAELQEMLTGAVVGLRAKIAEMAIDEQRLARNTLGSLLTELAGSYNELGEYEQAIATAREAIDLAQRQRQVLTEAQGYLQCGRAFYFLSRFDEAMPALNTALSLARTAQASSLCAAVHHTLGTVRLYRGEYDGGQAHYEEAMRLFQLLGEEQNELKVRYSLAVVLFFSGDYSASQTIYRDCLERYRAIGDQRSSGLLLNNLGAVYAQLGDFVQAETYYTEALALKRAIGDRPLESLILANIGQVANNRGEYEAALNHCRAALSIGRELGERATIAYAQTCLGYALAALGWHAEAAEVFGEAIALRRTLGQDVLALEPLAGLVSVHLALGNASHAQAQIETVLPHLKGVMTSGVVEPFRVFLAFYRVLQANHDVRGLDVLQTAYELLQTRAAGIGDEAQRRSYLTNVPAHRELVAEYERTPEARAAAGPQQWRRRVEQHRDLTRAVEDLLRPEDAPTQQGDAGDAP